MPRLPNGRGGVVRVGVSRIPESTWGSKERVCERCGIARIVRLDRKISPICRDCKDVLSYDGGSFRGKCHYCNSYTTRQPDGNGVRVCVKHMEMSAA